MKKNFVQKNNRHYCSMQAFIDKIPHLIFLLCLTGHFLHSCLAFIGTNEQKSNPDRSF